MTDGKEPIVALLVMDDRVHRAQVGSWLVASGLEVLLCSGPSAPDYACRADNGRTCPLAADADLVVLAMDLASDAAMQGMPSWQLLSYYRSIGLPVLALSDGSSMRGSLDDDVVVIRPPVTGEAVGEAVARLLTGRRRAAEVGRPT